MRPDRPTPFKINTVGSFGSGSSDTENDRSGLMSTSNWADTRRTNACNGVPNLCIGSTIEEHSRLVISDIPSMGNVR